MVQGRGKTTETLDRATLRDRRVLGSPAAGPRGPRGTQGDSCRVCRLTISPRGTGEERLSGALHKINTIIHPLWPKPWEPKGGGWELPQASPHAPRSHPVSRHARATEGVGKQSPNCDSQTPRTTHRRKPPHAGASQRFPLSPSLCLRLSVPLSLSWALPRSAREGTCPRSPASLPLPAIPTSALLLL